MVSLEAVADQRGVSEDAVESKSFHDHQRVGRTLVHSAVLDELAGEIETGMSFSEAEAVLSDRGFEDASAVLSELEFAVEREGLSGGTVREKE